MKSCNVKADILLARRRTDDISETQVPIKKIPFTFIDVGGQRTQREKWFQCFQDSINTILFFVAISEFDQTLVEDKRSNRVIESLKVKNKKISISKVLRYFLRKCYIFIFRCFVMLSLIQHFSTAI